MATVAWVLFGGGIDKKNGNFAPNAKSAVTGNAIVENFLLLCYNGSTMIKLTSLFSGSKGNCTLIQCQQTNVLLDLGGTCRSVLHNLQEMGLEPTDVSAIVVTHEHSDHIGALCTWQKKWKTPVFAPKSIAKVVAERCLCNVLPIDGSFCVGELLVETYACSHDSACCFGYRFSCGGEAVASVTDTGCFGQELVDFLYPCRTIQLESNHDENMVLQGPYPAVLKKRILSATGHLSNEQATQVLQKLIGSNVKNVVLAHLSEQNNTAELAFNTAIKMYSRYNLVEGHHINVFVAQQNKRSVTIE